MAGRVKMITHNGETLRQHEWLERTGLTRGELEGRFRRGWDTVDVLSIPPKGKRAQDEYREVTELTADLLHELLEYDAMTGVLYWKQRTGAKSIVGSRAGHLHTATGYWTIRLGSKAHLQHRLIWFMEFGVWPTNEIDHINRVRHDNRLANLRDVTRAENSANTTPGALSAAGKKGASVRWGKNYE